MQVRFNAIVAAVALLGAVGIASAQDAVIRIGHSAPLSGGQAHYGKDNENGARMAVDDLNAKGITIGGKKVRFELVAEDDAADPKQGTAVAQKFCDAKVAAVVGHLNSGVTLPASKIYSDCGIPMITPSSTNPKVTQNGYKNIYRLLANDNALGAGLALYAADSLKAKKVAVIDDRSGYGQPLAEIFKKTAESKGMEVVASQYTTDKAVDFTAILTQIKSKAPDAIFYGGMDPQAGPMLRQLEQLGMGNVKYLGGDGICTSELVKLSGGAKTIGNVTCAEGGASIQKMPGGTAWKARYDAKFPGQFQIYAPYVYDAVMVFADAMQRAGSWDPKVYAAELPKTNYQGVTTRVQFDEQGELRNPAITFIVFRDGKKVPLN
jgi:branched-chain amino acid transport system substrate-binding protein